ncbi:MAG: AsmA family protein, partial [Rhizobiales bacterium]|nr:AsmA family protein [Hyphomicrobiales bacterium]
MPWFIDWNAYRSTFERETEKILGQPVHVAGSADVTLLPMPSLTFTDVQVGPDPANPLMSVDSFSLHVELFPLLTGSFKVVDMAIERPRINVTVEADGSIDWLTRSEASKALDPDAVTLQRVEIAGGELSYLDSRTGRVVAIDDINATLDARSLLGPWKVEGGAVVEGTPTTLRLATGRLADNGTLRVKLEANPASAPVALSAEGDLGIDDKGLLWNGAFSLIRPPAEAGGEAPRAGGGGWRALGKFELRPSLLRLTELTLAAGPDDRPYG